MSLDWTHEFCLACDKQTDGSTYCSESCRLADFEKTSSSSTSGLSSPSSTNPTFTWSFSNPTTTSRALYLPPAYDFRNGQPYGTATGRRTSGPELTAIGFVPQTTSLSPSTSQTSLCSMKSTVSAESLRLSEKATRELRAYARSFESARLQRRRSY